MRGAVRYECKSNPLVAAAAMSRQILSYSDLDTSTTVTSKTVEVPNPYARHPEVQQMGPPKKKRKTNATHHRQTLTKKEIYQSTFAEALGKFSSGLVPLPLLNGAHR